VWWNIERYIEDNVLALCLPESNEDITSSSSSSSSQAAANKTVQFIPSKMLASLMANKQSTTTEAVDIKSKSKSKSKSKPTATSMPAEKRWLYSDWQEAPDDTAGSRSSRRQKRKEMLAQRVSAGWGCCLDCGAGDNGQVSPCEVSWSCLLLLRELRETVVAPQQEQEKEQGRDIDFDVTAFVADPDSFADPAGAARCAHCSTKTAAAQYLLCAHFKQLWRLLALADYKDCVKFHTFLYEQVTLALAGWFPATTPSPSLPPQSFPCFPPDPPAHVMSAPPPAPVMMPPHMMSSAASPFGAPPAPSAQARAPVQVQVEVQAEVKVEGRQRLALRRWVRGLLLGARPLLRRDFGCMGEPAAGTWGACISSEEGGGESSSGSGSGSGDADRSGDVTVPASSSSSVSTAAAASSSTIDLHSPQKDCALDACLKQIRGVFGVEFVKELLTE
jgi:hypothetical protein